MITQAFTRRRSALALAVAVALAAGAFLAGTGAGRRAAAATQPAPQAGPALARAAAGAPRPAEEVPPQVQVPPGNRLVARMDAAGVQVYQCTDGAWSFLEPAARLVQDYSPAAIHFRGPSWESLRDGSLVEATVVASSPVAGSIPLLLLHATRTRGDGVFGTVSYIQRLRTTGGAAPTAACATGETQAVPYTAQYRFYVPS